MKTKTKSHEFCVECNQFYDNPFDTFFKSGGWIKKATDSIKRRGTEGKCTGSKFGGPGCPPGSKAYNLAKTFRKMAKNRKEYGGDSTAPQNTDITKFGQNRLNYLKNHIAKTAVQTIAMEELMNAANTTFMPAGFAYGGDTPHLPVVLAKRSSPYSDMIIAEQQYLGSLPDTMLQKRIDRHLVSRLMQEENMSESDATQKALLLTTPVKHYPSKGRLQFAAGGTNEDLIQYGYNPNNYLADMYMDKFLQEKERSAGVVGNLFNAIPGLLPNQNKWKAKTIINPKYRDWYEQYEKRQLGNLPQAQSGLTIGPIGPTGYTPVNQYNIGPVGPTSGSGVTGSVGPVSTTTQKPPVKKTSTPQTQKQTVNTKIDYDTDIATKIEKVTGDKTQTQQRGNVFDEPTSQSKSKQTPQSNDQLELYPKRGGKFSKTGKAPLYFDADDTRLAEINFRRAILPGNRLKSIVFSHKLPSSYYEQYNTQLNEEAPDTLHFNQGNFEDVPDPRQLTYPMGVTPLMYAQNGGSLYPGYENPFRMPYKPSSIVDANPREYIDPMQPRGIDLSIQSQETEIPGQLDYRDSMNRPQMAGPTDDEFAKTILKNKRGYGKGDLRRGIGKALGPALDFAAMIGRRKTEGDMMQQMERLTSAENVFTPLSGDRGFNTFNPIGFDPGTNGVPVQFTGQARKGGSYKCGGHTRKYQEGGTYELTQDEIYNIMKAGGQIEYID